jgi:GTP-binding protein Era
VVDEMNMRADRAEDKPLMDIFAFIYVERESQKHIVIGRNGSRLKEVGTTAREAISKILGVPVFLDLRVKVAKDWQRDPKQLNRLGF